MRLTETYLALGVPQEAERSAAVLGANYRGTIWYARAYKLMHDHPSRQLAVVPPGMAPVPPGTPGARPKSLPGEAGTGTATAQAPRDPGTDPASTAAPAAPTAGPATTTPANSGSATPATTTPN